MLNHLISSQTRLDILSLFFKNSDKKYYAREVVKTLGLDQANVHKELANLVTGKFLVTENISGKKYFFANQASKFFSDLESMFKKYSANNGGDEIFCLEEMPNYYPLFTSPAWNAEMADEFSRLYDFKTNLGTLVTIFENNFCQLLTSKKDFYEMNTEIFNRVKDNSAWCGKYIGDLEKNIVNLYQASDRLRKTNLKACSDLELANIFEKFFKVYTDLHLLHLPQTVLDFGEGTFSKYLMSYLEVKVKRAGLSMGDTFSVLTTPLQPSKSAEEYRALLLILKDIISDSKLKEYFSLTESRIIAAEIALVDKKIALKLKKHVEGFGSLGYGMVGPGWNQEYFIDILSSLIRQKINPDNAIQESEENKIKTERRQQELEKTLDMDAKHLGIFKFARDLVFTKGSRKDAIFHALSVLENLYREISRRQYLSLRQVRYLNPSELLHILRGGNISAELLNERYSFSIYYSSNKPKTGIFLTGDKARDFVSKLNILKEEIGDIKILAGDCASPGRARGEVKIINIISDMAKMKVGDILISIATTPDLVPAIKKASAIVTDVGGITCHAAIISRELGIPCVVGTKVATKILQDGMIIDVDATHGKIDIISEAKLKKEIANDKIIK
ncbi:MAG: PEP-utilizing enzyme [Patescibacteria group bacterium]